MNIAPTDDDVFDPDAYIARPVTPPERAALAELQALGLRDVVRDHGRTSGYSPTGTTGQACSIRPRHANRSRTGQRDGRRPRPGGMVDRQARKGSGPSDHAGDRRPGRGSGRGDRTSRAALRPGGQARLGQATAVAVAAHATAGPSKHQDTRAPDRRAAGGSPELPRLGSVTAGGRDRARAARALARHLRVVGRVRHVPPSLGSVVLVHVQQRLQQWTASSIAAWRSRTSAKRAGIVATVKSSGATSASSSHVTGADTGALASAARCRPRRWCDRAHSGCSRRRRARRAPPSTTWSSPGPVDAARARARRRSRRGGSP